MEFLKRYFKCIYQRKILFVVLLVIGAAIGMYFRSAKRKIGKKLGYDENKNKEVESDEIIVNKEEAKK